MNKKPCKNKTSKKILITVSALALRTAIAPSAALAQAIHLSCPRDIFIGKFVVCSDTGRFLLEADGGSTTQSGCFGQISAAMRGTCTLKKSGPTAITKSVRVEFSKSSLNLTNGGGETISGDVFRMNTNITNSNNKKTLTFSAAKLNTSTISINVAGRMSLSGLGALGTFTATNQIIADFIP